MFAALIILAAVRMVFGQETERKAVVAACAVCGTWVARILPVTPVLHGSRFWVRQGGRLVATPLRHRATPAGRKGILPVR